MFIPRLHCSGSESSSTTSDFSNDFVFFLVLDKVFNSDQNKSHNFKIQIFNCNIVNTLSTHLSVHRDATEIPFYRRAGQWMMLRRRTFDTFSTAQGTTLSCVEPLWALQTF